uniref:C2H2-type domain-containing protein n=1 Tax=Phlebotomus papatasi TaxID=29031 RepID=A0A1B0D1G1_PHLPP
MGSLENPLIQCNTIRDLLNKLNRIYKELIDHENTLPKCEICWLNHAEFSSLKAQLILIVQDNATGKEEEHPAFEYVQLESGPEIQPFSSVIMKEEPEFVFLNNQCCPSDIESDDLIESTMEKSDLLEETDVLNLQNHQKTVHNMNISLKCQFCKEQFLNYRLIYRHHRKNHPQEPMPRSPHLCESCGLSMMNASDLSLHVIKYHNSSKLTCKVCNKGFAKEAELEEHRRIHIPISQLQDLYECDLCPKKFRMKLTFLKHKRLHTTNKITEMFCEVCGKRFINIEKLQEHQEKHAEEGTRDFKCDICGHQFKKINRVHSELIDHENTLPKCEICWQNHAEFNSLKSQILLIVQDDVSGKEERPTIEYVQLEENIQIQQLPIEVKDELVLEHHEDIPSPEPPEPENHPKSDMDDNWNSWESSSEPCETRFFRNSVTLERHKESRDRANLNCDSCSEKFCRATDLYNHQKIVHKVKTAFECRHCDQKFSNFRLIYKHHKTTHPKLIGPTRPFLCEMCGLSMVDSRDLNRHMMIHRGVKPHQCNICDKTFRLQTEVEQHRRVHIPISQLQDLYACDMCPKKFRMKLTCGGINVSIPDKSLRCFVRYAGDDL